MKFLKFTLMFLICIYCNCVMIFSTRKYFNQSEKVFPANNSFENIKLDIRKNNDTQIFLPIPYIFNYGDSLYSVTLLYSNNSKRKYVTKININKLVLVKRNNDTINLLNSTKTVDVYFDNIFGHEAYFNVDNKLKITDKALKAILSIDIIDTTNTIINTINTQFNLVLTSNTKFEISPFVP